MTTLSRRAALTASAATIGTLIAGCIGDGTDEWEEDDVLPVTTATQYQGPGCDCCDVYADYLQDYLDGELEVIVRDDLPSIKEEHGIVSDLRSCHTVEIDEYVVEGHMPVSVISSLLMEEPDIDGIALPGMPAGSPGMGGDKDGPWKVYEIEPTNDPEVYAEI